MWEPRDIELLGSCLRLAVDGPYFPDWEFATLMGMSREEMRALADAWPSDPQSGEVEEPLSAEQEAAGVSAANNLNGYPHGVSRATLEEQLGFGLEDVARLLESSRRWKHSGDRRVEPT
ncbi:MAG: hypothetical protein AAGD18_04465 [Actinomycetota bacterium]